MQSQNAEVLGLLKRSGRQGITQIDAFVAADVYRLAARIHDLRADGYEIETVNEAHKNGFHARYVLKRQRPAVN